MQMRLQNPSAALCMSSRRGSRPGRASASQHESLVLLAWQPRRTVQSARPWVRSDSCGMELLGNVCPTSCVMGSIGHMPSTPGMAPSWDAASTSQKIRLMHYALRDAPSPAVHCCWRGCCLATSLAARRVSWNLRAVTLLARGSMLRPTMRRGQGSSASSKTFKRCLSISSRSWLRPDKREAACARTERDKETRHVAAKQTCNRV
mmetsp:Transcript_36608/g.87478  ORF Transcript_36608/g.87478 Transcript_36608/m.87478 type:complete len:205 (-) Transcript_36608:68-682(-)